MTKLKAVARQSAAFARKQQRCYSAPTDGSIPAAKVNYIPTEGTYPKGFVVGSAHAGVKASNARFNDLTLIASQTPCLAAGLFTVNAFKAAPVQVSKQVLHQSKGRGIRGVVINSGCANAVTGIGGLEDALAMAKDAQGCFPRISDDELNIPLDNAIQTRDANDPIGSLLYSKAMRDTRMLVMSTGVIGQR